MTGPAITASTTARLPTRRGGRVYLAGALVSQACALLRYTVLARLLGLEQLGLVATLILVSNFFELISDTGSDRFLVQDREGDEPAVQKLVQLIFLSRGAFMAVGLALFALPVAKFYHEPALVVGLVVLGLSPLLRGLMHLDTRRFQRSNDFRAEGLGMLVSEILSLVATLVAAYLTRDYTAILYGLILRSLVVTVISHLTAERPYRLAYSAAIGLRLRAFSGPLIANGILLFFAGQSDRLMISGLVGLTALGHYSAVLLLVLYPTAALSRYISGIHLPHVASAPMADERDSPANLLAGDSLLLSLAIAVGFAAVGPIAVRLLFGAKFSEAPLLIGMIGVLQTGRFIRVWPTTLAIGLGQSRIVMANNLARMVGIPTAFAGLVLIGGATGVVAGFIVGEFAALFTAVILLNRARALAFMHDFDRIAAFATACAVLLGMLAALQHQWTPGLALLLPAGLLLVWVARRESASIQGGVRTARRILRIAR